MNPLSAFFAQFKIYIILAAAIALTIAFFLYRHSLIVDGVQKADERVLATTLDAQAKRTADLAKQAKVDAAIMQSLEETHALQLAAANASADDLNRRLRTYTAARSSGLAHPGDPATVAGPDVPSGVAASADELVERAQEGVNSAAARDGAKVTGLQNYITKECHK